MKKTLEIILVFFIFMFVFQKALGNTKLFFVNKFPIKNNTTHHNKPTNVAPILTAIGNQIYCPGSSIKIVTDITIIDPDDTGIDSIYIQISTGYVYGEDSLTLTGIHPNINTTWNSITGTLTLAGISSQPTYIQLISAIKDIEYSSISANPSGIRNFSISVGQANYLPSNGHYYLYIPNVGITWANAKTAAEASTYYGLQGYLATITSTEEAQIAGEQTLGAGWIGGSDEINEGEWKWMTGPEIGTVFWNGNFTGYSPNFAFWNIGEPNSFGDEDYAHITASGVGTLGSWNDLSNTGETSGNYQPKGYIVEYGGMPGDPMIQISTSTTISIPSITSTSTETRCGTGTLSLQAISNTGIVNWYQNAVGGSILATGNSFITPSISNTTIFYAVAHSNSCNDTIRTPVTAFVTQRPILTSTSPYYMCDETYTIIDVETSSGIMFWYDSPTSPNPIFLGTHFVVPNIHEDTIFYAEANYNDCLSERIPIQIKVYQSPVAVDENIKICVDQPLILDAENPGMTYLWSTGETTQTIEYDGQTNYSVIITTLPPESCSKTKNFNITEHASPEISTVNVSDLNVTIIPVQNGDFEFSIDGENFQDSNVFFVPEGGIYTAYIREKNGCGSDEEQFTVISVPNFFTPNNDNYNDHWSIKGIENYSQFEITIFDRFGRLITFLNKDNPSWNGTFNGRLLPSSDYWYVAKINNLLPEKKGHFTLKR